MQGKIICQNNNNNNKKNKTIGGPFILYLPTESKLIILRKAYAIVMLIQKPNEIITVTEYHVRMEHQENFKS